MQYLNRLANLLLVENGELVILTAAHCIDGRIARPSAGTINSVGVSFDQDNVINGSFSDGTYYVRGGTPLFIPEQDALLLNI